MAGLQLTLIAVGRLKEDYWRAAAAEYEKRLSAYVELKSFELADQSTHSLANDTAVLAAEAAEIRDSLDKLPADTVKVLLDISGQPTSSEALAERLLVQAGSGRPRLCFIVGGSLGVAPEIRDLADERLSFGPLTLPHNLARIVLLEQLYRACRINRHEPYHK